MKHTIVCPQVIFYETINRIKQFLRLNFNINSKKERYLPENVSIEGNKLALCAVLVLHKVPFIERETPGKWKLVPKPKMTVKFSPPLS